MTFQAEREGMAGQARLTRRAALRGAGIAGGTALLGRGLPVAAQEATPATDGIVYPELVITAAEFSFEMPATAAGGLTRLTMRNAGAADHHAMFMRLNEGAAFADLEAAMAQPDIGAIFALAASLGGPVAGPGEEATAIVDLEAGQYLVICAVPDERGMPHYMMGMHAPLTVTGDAPAGPAPAAAARIEMVDFAFSFQDMDMDTAMEMAFPAGEQVWEIANSGAQVHEMVILRQGEGVSYEQAEAMLLALGATPAPGAEGDAATPEMSGPPPLTAIGGAAPMNPGYTNWAVLSLEAGEYVAACFVPDPASGQLHIALGMIMPFHVA